MKPSDPRAATDPRSASALGVPLPPSTIKSVAPSQQQNNQALQSANPREGCVKGVPNNNKNAGRNHHFNGGRRGRGRRMQGNFAGQDRKKGYYGANMPGVAVGMTPPPPPPPNGARNTVKRHNVPAQNFGGNHNHMAMQNNSTIRNPQMRGNGSPFQGERRNSNMNVIGRANDFPMNNGRNMRGNSRVPTQSHNFGQRPGVPPPPPRLQVVPPGPGMAVPPPPPPTQHRGVGPASIISHNMRPLIHDNGNSSLPPGIPQNGNNIPPPPPPPKQDKRHVTQYGQISNSAHPPIPPPQQQRNSHPFQQQEQQHHQQFISQMTAGQHQQFSPMQSQSLGNSLSNTQQHTPHRQPPASRGEAPFQKPQFATPPTQHLSSASPLRQQGIRGSPQNATLPSVSIPSQTNMMVNDLRYPASQIRGMTSLQIPREGQSTTSTTQQQRVHLQKGVPPSSSGTAVDDQNVAANWSTHKAPTGVNYYYNSKTKVSTYDRPACLRAETNERNVTASSQESVQSQSPSVKSTLSNATQATTLNAGKKENTTGGKQKWTEYTDQATGKTYYYDGVRTTWDKPADFESTTSNASKKTKRNGKSATDESTPRKKRKDGKSNNEISMYSNKAEAVAAFKGLLLAKDVSPTLKWNDVVRLCSSDSRWEACSTMGERKQALAEFQTKRANEIREQKRQEKVRAKEAFMALLTEVLPTLRVFNASGNTGFGEIRGSLSKDDRFYAVEEEVKREELFYDFVEELRKREERQRRGRKRDGKEAFIAFLKYREEAGCLTFASTWSSFLATLGEKDKGDKRFVVSPSMSDSDRQLYFADYVIELQAAEDEKRRRIRDARRRAEKAQRDAYRETLRLMAVEGKLLPSSRWRNFEDLLSSKKSFGPVSEQDRDAPRDMFEDFVDDWADSYRRDKLFLSRLVSSSKNLTVNADTQLESFTKAILSEAAYDADVYSDVRRIMNCEEPISNMKLYYDELVTKKKKDIESTASFGRRRGVGNRNDSSSDEGEIVEDGEVKEDTKIKVES